ncbi:4-hydroxythreonine-4-phosphate dehydrogenase PdxA [Spirulina sp. CS-785/01]|uniref:4-hydroxythreonine-4-phosphate dehydrogenase PdxA n=1 Tax=Spirulina sp. CS-785/01 TaxID=3021716 RepID=UPI00232BD546|nr:4-hydroxythreonine-4-phosphate dehydrogenase PdxA [Spirulina sp. CS-785/01]MDB9315064.1 4-hydroxythreonine-4-phosphate dehydrogenase PdxA [Spirulina sp. CS-785/01]
MQMEIAIPIGDPAGIGPEVVLKALADPEITQKCQITLVGERTLLEAAYINLLQQGVEEIASPSQFTLLDIPLDQEIMEQIEPGKGNAASGEASFKFLDAAIRETLAGGFQGIVTAPIAKSHWQAAGYNYPGQTEVLASRSGCDRFGMLFVGTSPHTGWRLITLLATTHIPLHQVSETLTPELLTGKLDLLIDTLKQDFGIESPTIAISGLNPHSGEDGQLGREEKDWMQSWLMMQQHNYPQTELVGPVPPDTLWVKPGQAWFHDSTIKTADGYLALYHDQGLIPVKLMAFDQAINTTIGLPFIRTSPDHGTAFDIAGKGVAKAESMKAAIQLASELTMRRFSG